MRGKRRRRLVSGGSVWKLQPPRRGSAFRRAGRGRDNRQIQVHLGAPETRRRIRDDNSGSSRASRRGRRRPTWNFLQISRQVSVRQSGGLGKVSGRASGEDRLAAGFRVASARAALFAVLADAATFKGRIPPDVPRVAGPYAHSEHSRDRRGKFARGGNFN